MLTHANPCPACPFLTMPWGAQVFFVLDTSLILTSLRRLPYSITKSFLTSPALFFTIPREPSITAPTRVYCTHVITALAGEHSFPCLPAMSLMV